MATTGSVKPFPWQNYVLTPAALLGGNNGAVGQIKQSEGDIGLGGKATVDSRLWPASETGL